MRKIYELKKIVIEQLDADQRRDFFASLAARLNSCGYDVYKMHYKPNGVHSSTYRRNIGVYSEENTHRPRLEFVDQELPKVFDNILAIFEIFEEEIANVALPEKEEKEDFLFDL